jgi:hypothetical protein
MAKRQTRRTVSLSGEMIAAIKEAAEQAGVSASQYVHEAVARRMTADGLPAPRHSPPSYGVYGVSIEIARLAAERRDGSR